MKEKLVIRKKCYEEPCQQNKEEIVWGFLV